MSFETLPARYFTDPAVFREELEKFYCSTWICAGRSAAIPNPGDYFLREIAAESIIVVRSETGAVHAFYNVCRHRGTRICSVPEGAFPGRMQCPYHSWTYSFDGRLLGALHMDPATFSREDYPLRQVACDLWDGHIFLNLSPTPEPLAAQLADLPQKFAPWRMAELKLGKRIVYEVAANWKLLVQNYNECLHCPVLHPALNRLTDYMGADNEGPAPSYIGGSMGFRGNAETMSLDGRRRREYLPGLNADEQRKVCYYAIYPNLLLSLHPDYMLVHTLWPKSVNHTQIVCEFHFHPDELAKPGFVSADAIEFWDLTNREDWHICELSQLGISSRAYAPGPYSKREELLHAFDQMILRENTHGH